MLANVADGIYGLDADGRVEFVNPSAVRITGYPLEEQRAVDQHRLLHHHRLDGSPYPRQECPVWQAMRTGRTVTADDEVFWHKDGTPVPVELIAVPTVEDGVVTGVIVSFRDLTERRAAAAQAAELDRLARQAATSRALSDRLQQALLTPPPEPDHLHVVVRYLPAGHESQVGGDWYDAFLQPDGATMLAIGDVVGHGSDAAAAMGQLRGHPAGTRLRQRRDPGGDAGPHRPDRARARRPRRWPPPSSPGRAPPRRARAPAAASSAGATPATSPRCCSPPTAAPGCSRPGRT